MRFHACFDSYLNYSKPSSCAGSHGLRPVGLVWNYSRANYASYPSRYRADPKERQFYENYDRGSSHPSVMNQIWLAWLPVLNAPAHLHHLKVESHKGQSLLTAKIGVSIKSWSFFFLLPLKNLPKAQQIHARTLKKHVKTLTNPCNNFYSFTCCQ